jgi:hypothetical protein
MPHGDAFFPVGAGNQGSAIVKILRIDAGFLQNAAAVSNPEVWIRLLPRTLFGLWR